MPSQVLSWFVGHCGWSIFPPRGLSKEHMHQTWHIHNLFLIMYLSHPSTNVSFLWRVQEHCSKLVPKTHTQISVPEFEEEKSGGKAQSQNSKDYSNQLTKVIFWTFFTLLEVKCLKSWARNTKRPKKSSFVYLNLRHFRLQTTTPTYSWNSSWISSS